MIISKFRASALMLALMFSVFATGQTTQWRDIHKVKKGETLYSIAKRRGTTVDAIMKLNHLKKNAKLKVGQILKYN